MSNSLEGRVLALEAMLAALMRRTCHLLPASAIVEMQAEASDFVEMVSVQDQVRSEARQSIEGIFGRVIDI